MLDHTVIGRGTDNEGRPGDPSRAARRAPTAQPGSSWHGCGTRLSPLAWCAMRLPLARGSAAESHPPDRAAEESGTAAVTVPPPPGGVTVPPPPGGVTVPPPPGGVTVPPPPGGVTVPPPPGGVTVPPPPGGVTVPPPPGGVTVPPPPGASRYRPRRAASRYRPRRGKSPGMVPGFRPSRRRWSASGAPAVCPSLTGARLGCGGWPARRLP